MTYNIILLIPFLIISVCVLDLFKKHQYEKVENEVKMTFERQDDFLNNRQPLLGTLGINADLTKFIMNYIGIHQMFIWT